MENNNREKELIPPFVATFFDRLCCTPKSEAEYKWWASELLRWCERDDALVFYEFAAIMGISQGQLSQYALRSPTLLEAMKVAKSIVGARRERLALKNELNASIVIKTMANYNDEYAAYEREMKMLGADSDKPQTINVMMPKMPETDAVPKKGRKKKEQSN